jgi:thiol-disulfide isomerase/thioredoxin
MACPVVGRDWVATGLRTLSALVLSLSMTGAGAGTGVEVKPWAGGTTPVLDFENMDGTPFDASTLRGKKVVLNFWAVWCAPCREEIPLLERLAQSMQGQGVEILLVNAGDSRESIKRFLSRTPTPIKLRVLRTRGESVNAGAWQINVLPTTAVIDATGRARWLIRGAIDSSGEPLREKLIELSRKK